MLNYPRKIEAARKTVGRPLTLAEKILVLPSSLRSIPTNF